MRTRELQEEAGLGSAQRELVTGIALVLLLDGMGQKLRGSVLKQL